MVQDAGTITYCYRLGTLLGSADRHGPHGPPIECWLATRSSPLIPAGFSGPHARARDERRRDFHVRSVRSWWTTPTLRTSVR